MGITSTLVFNRLPERERQLRSDASQVVRTTALEVQAWIQEQMAEPKSGRDYGDHVASAPGEPPAIDTGAYVNDVRAETTGPLAAIVATNQEQATELEFGSTEVDARPVWQPAIEAARPGFERKLKDILT